MGGRQNMMRTRMLQAVATGVLWVCVAGVPTALAADAEEYVAEAREHIAAGEMKAAIIQLKNALQDDPAHVPARLLLGSLHLRGSDGAAAAKEFRRARDLGAPASEWLPGYASALLLQGEFASLLEEAVVDEGLAPGLRAELHAMRGNAQLALGQVDPAVTEYDAALALDGGNPVARLGKARILLGKGQSEQALEQLDQVLREYPDHVESRLARGDLRRRMQQLGEAEADYRHAVEQAPTNPRAHVGLALVHIAQRDIEAAKQDLVALNRLTRDLPAVNHLQALVSFQERDFERASEELQVLLRAAPSNLQAQLLYGIVSYARNEFTIADDYLTRVLASTPGNPQVVKLLGAARLKLREPDRAVQVLSTIVDETTQDAQLLALLGTALIQTGDNSRGAEYIERAVELDPDQALLRTQLAVGRIATGDTGGAISQLESAVALGQDVVQADVLLVLSYLNRREYDKAITASEALEARMADSPIPFNLTGLALLAQRQFDAAQRRFELALEKDPDFLVAQMNLARLALVAQRPADAEAAYQKVLAKDPRHLGALMGMATLARSRQDLAAAEEWMLKANQADPRALQPVLLLAESYLRQGEGLKASNLLSGLTPEQLDLPAVLRLRGMSQLQSGDFANAVFTLGRLTEMQPESMEGWFQLARAHAAAGDNGRARESFQRAIALDRDYKVPVVWVGLGELELRDKRYNAALELAARIRTHFPDKVFGHDIAAAAHRGKGEVSQALAAIEAGFRIEPSSPRANSLARALAGAGQGEQAVQVLRDWLDQQPEDGGAWANLGLIEQQAGRETEALAAYEKSLALSEPSAVLLNNMAWLYLERDGERALELATRAYELAPARAEIIDTYGWVLFHQGRRSDGLAALQQALIIAPRNAEIALHVAEALHELERDAEARPLLQRVVRDFPNTDFERSARALLGRLRG
jgi:putative PEP-CTERM system TPR-repeat lipoprotein